MSWARTAKSWFFRIQRAGTRPVGALRQFSSQGSPISQPSHSFRMLLFTSLSTGLVGFALAKSFPSLGHESESPQFGSPRDFKKAIQELQSTFPTNDKVSVDPDDLYIHGFSPNDHHPGMYE
jgi:D-lactate dehydrogenase (cytochrome)